MTSRASKRQPQGEAVKRTAQNGRGKLKVPRKLLPFISRKDMEKACEAQLADQLVPKPEAKLALKSAEFDRRAASRAFKAADDPTHRGPLLVSELACVVTTEHSLDVAASLMQSLRPRTPLEVLLFNQMAGVHLRAMSELGKAAHSEDQETSDWHTSRAIRLARTFCQQVETLQMLRAKGKPQRVIVKHVNVNVGGQAIMGSVTASTPGVRKKCAIVSSEGRAPKKVAPAAETGSTDFVRAP